MEEKKSCCCGSLPKGLWWLLTLLGLPLLYFLMFNANKDPIESDLTQRVKSALHGQSLDWVNVNVDERGRDVLLSGEAPSPGEGDKALALARSVEGVRIAEGEFTEFVATEDMTLNVTFEDGEIKLDGEVASQTEADAIVAAATERVGEGNVINNLVVNKKVKHTGWLDKLTDLFKLGVDGGSMSLTSEGLKYTGTVDSEDKKNGILDGAKELLGSLNIPIINGLSVVLPEPEPEPVAVPEPTPEPVAADTPKPDPAVKVEPEPEPEPVAEPEPTEQEKAIMACQSRLNEVMEGKSIHFSTNAAVIKEDSYPLLNEIAAVITECHDAISGGVEINGHTDSRGDDSYNMALSLRRAQAVKKYLTEHQVNATLLKPVGHGETSPIASNDTPEGMAQNRRITFTIIKE